MSSKSSKKSPNADKSSKEDGSSSERLPFEPTPNSKKTTRKHASTPGAKGKDGAASQSSGKTPGESGGASAKSGTIPPVVSNRMVRRVAFFSGIPAFLGMATLVISYIVISRHWLELPHVAVLLVNMGFFGLSVLGLSYGAISASWDEDRVGHWFGWGEFKTNFARLRESWRAAKQKPSS
ncbi:PAM68 family protein [Kovacikia minuta CCNUW1]|uniref:PAM68 family protein n=1 Tax=Kovacikia minuta TaxID=2931930 RepID=UPI001CCC5891|nr:PAM68 family protein [Kovacikia minuta]UBF26503.1 PAM68 family protein [Kovacikia minuta CCNUW1]